MKKKPTEDQFIYEVAWVDDDKVRIRCGRIVKKNPRKLRVHWDDRQYDQEVDTYYREPARSPKDALEHSRDYALREVENYERRIASQREWLDKLEALAVAEGLAEFVIAGHKTGATEFRWKEEKSSEH